MLHVNYMLTAQLHPAPGLGQPLTWLGGVPTGSPIARGLEEEEDEAAEPGAVAFIHLRGTEGRVRARPGWGGSGTRPAARGRGLPMRRRG